MLNTNLGNNNDVIATKLILTPQMNIIILNFIKKFNALGLTSLNEICAFSFY